MQPTALPPRQSAAPLVWKLVASLWVAFLLNYTDRQVVFSIFPALRRDLGFSEAQLGAAGSAFLWVYSICMPLTGRLADALRRDRVIVASLVLWSAATLGSALSTSVVQFLCWRAAMGVTEALYVPAAFSLIASFHDERARSRALGIHATAQFTGLVAGGSLGGWLSDHAVWRYGFAALAAAGIAYAFLLARVLRQFRGSTPAVPVPAKPWNVLRSHCYLALTAAFVAFNALLWMLYAWLPDWMREQYGITMAASGFRSTFYLQASTAIGVLLGGAAGDRLSAKTGPGRFYVLAFALAACAPFAWLTFAAPSLTVATVCSAVFGLISGLAIANLFASAYDVISERNYGFGAGILNLFGGLSGGTAVFFGGAWKESAGIPGLAGIIAVAAALFAAILFVVSSRTFHADQKRRDVGIPHT